MATKIARTVLTKRHARCDSVHLFSSDAQITNAFLYHKCVTGTMIAATILMNAIVSSPPALKIATLVPAESVFHGSGSVTVTTIVETKAMSRRVFVAITPAIVTRDFSVTPHASAFLSFGSVTEMPTVMTDRTKMWKFAQDTSVVLVLFNATIIAAFRKTGGVTLRMIVKTAQMKQDVRRALVRALNLGVALVVVSAWTGFVMVTMIAEIQQTSGTVSTLLAERGSFAVAVVTVLPRSGSVMGVKIAKMLQMNKVVQLVPRVSGTAPHNTSVVRTRCVFIRCGSAMGRMTVEMKAMNHQSFVRLTAAFTISFVAKTMCASPNGSSVMV